ncbi:TPA: TrbC/VirB2 family protein [Streptococcus equi subsp. zooepidemicus]|nr:TrbC/VirB2 family protein [Streptococcus equi subsp. zooepidemicus]HEL0633942.1 TrbC/VirB2 family protein [Streptococcus equi subsp. zooepidemicus]HEL1089138.1 TrbC/VirB2 family protein [Streptococcus equi subsp. zooepidemicus]
MQYHLTLFFKQLKESRKRYWLSLSLFLTSLLSQTAYADDPFAKMQNLANQGITKFQTISAAVFGVALVATGLVYGFSGRDTKAAIKKHWIQIFVGIVFVTLGPAIVQFVIDFVKS